ncbi:hypothetical protein CQW23_04620 [Capsicum baccatum]|uniref:F-box domain-containing protein n=1 Tax=Capsicum baccatum TaxID=33114 RepID=A0A2G2XF82_CAPBA|nr:hypothetical protein CQW23_04620 [Capsicum baccatum]
MSHSDSSQSESENVETAYVDQCYGDKTVNKPDRLSALPDHLLLHILSSFQMKDVIITGVLSQRWRLLWTSAHNLCFSHSLESNRDVTKFIKSIDDTLILSKPSKLKKFSIEFLYRNNQFLDHVNRWMIFVTIKSVERLDLNLMRGSKEGYSLPQLMYSNVHLHKLKLSNCNLVPNEGINWPVLRVLSLWNAKLSLEVVDVICSGCHGLESLKFYEDSDDDNDDDKELTIWARNVTSFEISGWFHKKIPVLQNVQALVDAKLYFFEFRINQKMLNDLLALLESSNWRCPWMKCKYLNLSTRLDALERPGLAILLQSCPQVETLIISSESTFEPSMPFMEAVLKNGIVLEKIILTPFKDGIWAYPMQHARVTLKLLSFPRSSEDAVIVFSG